MIATFSSSVRTRWPAPLSSSSSRCSRARRWWRTADPRESLEPVAAQKALGHLRRRAADRDPVSVAGPVTAARPGVARAAAVARPQAAERRHIRPAAGRAAKTAIRTARRRSPGRRRRSRPGGTGEHDGVARHRGPHAVGERKARHDRAAVRLAVHLGKSAGRLDQRAESRTGRCRAGLPPRRKSAAASGRDASARRSPSPGRAARACPARTTPSARRTAAASAAAGRAPRGAFRFSVTNRLLRA